MASLSAADLQKRFAEGDPDPFPAFNDDAPTGSSSSNGRSKKQGQQQRENLDLAAEDAFPSLASAPAPAQPKASMWGASKPKSITRAPAQPPKPVGFSESFQIAVGVQTDRDGKQVSLSTIMKAVQDKTGCTFEASTAKKTGLTTFVVKGSSQRLVDSAVKQLTARVSKVVSLTIDAPISVLGTIIGPKGTTLRSITDSTGTKIDIPKRDAATEPQTNGASDADSDVEDEEPEEPTVTITISGPQPSALEAQSILRSLIGERTSRGTTRISDIPSTFFPFIARESYNITENVGGGREVKINIPPPAILKAFRQQAEAAEAGAEGVVPNGIDEGKEGKKGGKKDKDLSIIVNGEKGAVADVVQAIRSLYEQLRTSTMTLNFSIPKRQHRFLVGSNADDILNETGCIVELPSIEDVSDQIVIRGPQTQLSVGLQAVINKANAIAVETLDLSSVHRSSSSSSDPLVYGKSLVRYLVKSSKFRKISEAHAPTKIYPPFPAAIETSNTVVVELVGEDRSKVASAKAELMALVSILGPASLEHVEIDSLIHKFLIGKKGSKMAQFTSQHGVEVIFPLESEQSSDVLLVAVPEASSGNVSAADKKARDSKTREKLQLVKDELLKLAGDVADIKTSTIDVDRKWHSAIVGSKGSVLNAVIGEEKLVIVNVGNKKADSSDEGADTITIRGPSSEAQRVEKEILRIVEEAKNHQIENGHVASFVVDRAHIGHLVGSNGSAINKLRDELNVNVQFDDDASPSSGAFTDPKADKKKKTAGSAKATCKIVGRKEAAEEAKRRLLAQVEKLADETTVSVIIPKAHHAGLIGSAGKYAIRLEEKYGVKITFPRGDREGSDQKPDEVIIRGGKKGVASAKAELLEAAEYEKETGQSISFTIPSRAVARVLGKAGSQINEIKEETEAQQIDVDKADASSNVTTITVRGTKKAINAAKTAILAVASQVGEETTTTTEIDQQYHRSIIGAGGSNLKQLIVSCGGPDDSRQQAGLVSFPKGSDSGNTVSLRGEPALVNKIKAELERIAAELKDRVVLGISVPVLSHASKIGRGGSALLDLQKKTNTTIQFPGSRQYNSFGEIENASDLAEADPKTIVKVGGSRSAVAAAIEELSKEAPGQQQRSQAPREARPDELSEVVQIPKIYQTTIAGEKGIFFRNLRNIGVIVDNPPTPPKAPTPRPTKAGNSTSTAAPAGRIDDDEDEQNQRAPAMEIEYMFEIFDRFEGDETETVSWTLKSRDAGALEKAKERIDAAIKAQAQASKLGVLAGLPQSAFARIVGTKGQTVQRLRAETGAEIYIPREQGADIEITGDLESVELARDAIVSIASRPSNRF